MTWKTDTCGLDSKGKGQGATIGFLQKWTLGFNVGRDILHQFFWRNPASHFLNTEDVSQLHVKFRTEKNATINMGPILYGHRPVGSGHFVVSQDFTQPGLWKGWLPVHGLADGIHSNRRLNLSHLNSHVRGYNSGFVYKCRVVTCQDLIYCFADVPTHQCQSESCSYLVKLAKWTPWMHVTTVRCQPL